MKSATRLKTYYLRTFGCQMNENDSERIAGILEEIGLKRTEDIKKADVIIYNTCSVRHTAEDRVFGLGKNIRSLKESRNVRFTTYDLPITIVTGCMVRRRWIEGQKEAKIQEAKFNKMLRRRLGWADIILEITDISLLKFLLFPQEASDMRTKRFPANNAQQTDYLSIRPLHNSAISAAVPISTGCNEFCTFCIVPYARGKLKHRDPQTIINEVKDLTNKGYKDITLLGQIVNQYQWEESQNMKLVTRNKTEAPRSKLTAQGSQFTTFLDLLKSIDQIPGNFWLTFLSSYPNYFTDEIIAYIARSVNKAISGKSGATSNHIRPYIHVAMQSGSNKILQKMNRKYTIEQFIERCKKIKKEIPIVNLSTDIIVGFPNETAADFNETLEVIKELNFDMAYINQYSPRSGTAAFFLEDNVTHEVKEERDRRANDVLRKTALKNNLKLKSKKLRVLIEKIVADKKSPKNAGTKRSAISNQITAYGKTFNYKNIQIPLKSKSDVKVGNFVIAKVTKARSWSLEGKIYSPS